VALFYRLARRQRFLFWTNFPVNEAGLCSA